MAPSKSTFLTLLTDPIHKTMQGKTAAHKTPAWVARLITETKSVFPRRAPTTVFSKSGDRHVGGRAERLRFWREIEARRVVLGVHLGVPAWGVLLPRLFIRSCFFQYL